ncbi:MAG TPA: hypothetical protein VN253_15875 [Kofleriaceae bacterium]|nr:hypothetical protein [Kofleriaceae bacterium]
MTYRIQLTDAREARDHLLPIWRTNLAVVGPPDAKLRWFYSDGPHGPGRAFLIYPERERAAPIGAAGVGVRALRFGDRSLRAALFADLAVERAHRSGLPAIALVRAVKHHVSESFDLGYGFPNAKAVAIYRRVGCRQLGEMQRFVRVLRVGRHLGRRVLHVPLAPLVARGAGAIADRALAAVTSIRARGIYRQFALAWLDEFDGRFDELWRESRNLAPIAGERTAALLAWRFGRQPGHHYRIAALIERSTERLCAYAVVRDGPLAIELTDLFGVGLLEIDVLLRCLLPALYDTGAPSVSFRFLGTPRLVALLRRHGFTRRPEALAVTLSFGADLAAEPALIDPASWFLTDLDQDS